MRQPAPTPSLPLLPSPSWAGGRPSPGLSVNGSKTHKRFKRTLFNQTIQGKMRIFKVVLFFKLRTYKNKQWKEQLICCQLGGVFTHSSSFLDFFYYSNLENFFFSRCTRWPTTWVAPLEAKHPTDRAMRQTSLVPWRSFVPLIPLILYQKLVF